MSHSLSTKSSNELKVESRIYRERDPPERLRGSGSDLLDNPRER